MGKLHYSPQPSLNLWIILALFMVVAVSPMLDLAISRFFYRNGIFYLSEWGFFPYLRFGIPEFLVVVAAVIGLVWIYNKISGKDCLHISTRVMLLTTGTMLLVPIGIVNGIFKTFWGRARPKDILEFGGDKLFSPPLVISNQCDWDCSFMSGHTAISFWVLSLALLTRHKYRPAAILAAVVFGVVSGIARIAQGNHFFSDVFFAAVVTSSIILWLYAYLFEEEAH